MDTAIYFPSKTKQHYFEPFFYRKTTAAQRKCRVKRDQGKAEFVVQKPHYLRKLWKSKTVDLQIANDKMFVYLIYALIARKNNRVVSLL